MPVEFDYRALGRLLAGRIDRTGRGYRAVCAEIGIAPAAVSRLRAGQPVAAHTVLTACAWLGCDIGDFTTGGFTGNAVKQVKKQAVGMREARP